ncbi:aldehyde dehydrogenase family protein [uncultured Hymenobacter sp.]|uniref:aldehyde dehydrogenase family protein n=1 Tax=uncultured Hymenobacter sp. TaxID=170016 RepID=UPI0035CAFDB3
MEIPTPPAALNAPVTHGLAQATDLSAAPAANRFQLPFEALRAQAPVLRAEDAAARCRRLRRLSNWLMSNREAVQQALYADFRKPPAESDLTEIWTSLTGINHAIKNLKTWMRPRPVPAPLSLVGTRSWVQVEAKGVALIIAPWNYPFYLAVEPLASALAAGNCCVVKPSELTPHTAALISRLARELFPKNEVLVVEGDKDVATELLQLPWDHIFFTGSPEVGKIVMRAAAAHLSGLTLELGGKSPAVVDETANLRDAAEKIVWGKFLNAGQTCVAPDYVLAQESVKDELVREMQSVIKRLYNPGGAGIQASDSFARIVNKHHFRRLAGLLEDAQTQGATVVQGGTIVEQDRYIEPTILTDVPATARVLEEEIFGPLLPVLSFGQLPEAVQYINARLRPLAQYFFTQSPDNRRLLLGAIPAGGAAVNEAVLHFAHPELPTGGVGNSGLGKSHGYAGFLAFSNEKGVLRQRVGLTAIKALYPPYTGRVRRLIGLLVKYL